MSNIPSQTTKNSKARRVQPSVSSMDLQKKIGVGKLTAHQKSAMVKRYYERRQVLRVPQDIIDANPDKHFVYINLNELQAQGGWHTQGYRLYKTAVDTENMNGEKFDKMNDGLVHRNEMALAYLPKQEFEEREMERAVVRATRDMTEILTQNDALRGFAPHAEETKQQVNIQGE